MMKTIFLFCFGLFFATGILAQKVVSSAGGSGSVNGVFVDWTLGEPVIETLTGSNNTVTQGMHQPLLLTTPVQDLMIPGFTINVYPNPASTLLTIEVIQRGDGPLHCEISDISGRKLILTEMPSNIKKIDMSGYAAGTYFLRLFTPDTKHKKVCKIIKK